jgi:Ca2+-binding RTX toxin-like protein
LALTAGAAPAGAAKCTKKGTNGDDVLRGKNKNDVLCGRGGNDVLIGKAGKDTLLGGGGDDTLDGGKGNDKLKGGGGADTATFAAATGTVVVNLANGTASGIGSDKLSGVENVIGSPQTDILTGDDGANSITGGEGDDTLAGGLGDDALDGGGGVDKVNYFSATSAIDVDLSADTATGQGSDSVPGVEDVTGSPHDDTLAGDAADNTLHGGAGEDTVSFAGAASGVSVDLATRTATGDGNDSMPATENIVASDQDDTITAVVGPNAIDGGGGEDTVSYAATTAGVTVDLVNETVTGGDDDTVQAVENVTGTDQADVLVGGPAANVFLGGGGSDTIAAGGGSDDVSGEGGNDAIYGEANDDLLSGGDGDDLLDGGSGTDTCDGGAGTNQFAGGCDTDAPTLVDFSVAPASIDTSTGSQLVTFTAHLTDQITGVDENATQVTVFAPDGSERATLPVQLASGDVDDGTFEASFTVPQYAPQGSWTVALELVDQAANAEPWSSGELVAASFPSGFSQTGPGDDTPPILQSFAINPGSIDTSASSQSVTFTLDLTDDLAGVDLSGSRVSVFNPSGDPRGEDTLSLVSGTPTNGTFEATVTIPRYAQQGTWTVTLDLADDAGNLEAWSTSELSGDLFPATFDQTAPGDETAPTLTSFSLNPSQINTTASAQSVDFDVHLSDDLAGVDLATTRLVVTAPNGAVQQLSLQLDSGTLTDGDFSATLNVPQGAIPGTWALSLVLVDGAENTEQWTASELQAASFPSSFTNVGLDPN